MIRAGRLHPVLPGVFALGHTAESELTREIEVLLACPRDTVLSHLSAAALWKLVPPRRRGDPVDVTVLRPLTLHIPGVRSHRSSTLDAKYDLRIHHGLPTVSPARALVEIAAELSVKALERALDDGLHRNIVRLTQARDALTRTGRHRKGAALMDALLRERESGSGITRSGAEQDLWLLILEARLLRPKRNYRLLGYEADFCWPELKVIVEVDSYEYHLRKASFDSDRAKDVALEAQGYTVLRFTAKQIAEEPLAVIAMIATVLTRASSRVA